MNNEIIIPELNEETIESMIYEIRGIKVMLDFELAKIYGYSTKAFNQQVKNNVYKFPPDFMFRITKEEMIFSRSKNFTLNGGSVSRGTNFKYLPYAFTEQGIYMLMTVLKGELATKQSIAIIRTFKQMKDYIIENNSPKTLDNIISLTNQVKENTNDIKDIKNDLKIVMDNFIDPNKYKEFIILNNERIEASIAYQSIYKQAKESIFIIDDYVEIKTLENLKVVDKNIIINIFSDNKAKNKITKNNMNDFKKDTNIKINIFELNNIIHDRLIVIDYNKENERIYASGTSSKDAGSRISFIYELNKTDILHYIIDEIIRSKQLII